MKQYGLGVAVLAVIITGMGQANSCGGPPSSDQVQQQRTEQLTKEAVNAVGIPAVTNFREMRLLKDIYELRDQDGLTTYTYTFSEMTGKLTFFCTSVGYAIPFATQFSNPEKITWVNGTVGYESTPQAEPNGLFMPASAEASWVMCLEPTTKTARAVYSEPRLVVSPFKLTEP